MMKNKKAVLDYLKVYVFMATLAFHNIAFAATDPKSAFANVLNGIMGIMLFLAPICGALALIWYGLQYYFAKESHAKAELKGSMFSCIWITALIFTASGIIKYIVSQAS